MHIHRSREMAAVRNAKGRGRLEIQSSVSKTNFGELAANGLSDFLILHGLSQYSFKGGDAILVNRTWSVEVQPTDYVERRLVPDRHPRTREEIFPIANVCREG